MKHGDFTRSALGLSAALALLLAGSAQAAPAPTTSTTTTMSCSSTPTLYQPFLSAGDPNSYVLPVGESYDNVSGTGWTLSGGAKLVTTTLANGQTGQVLDLPAGANATSPTVCVNNLYPQARMELRNVGGIGGMTFAIGYYGTSTWSSPQGLGRYSAGTAWNLLPTINLVLGPLSGWQQARFTFTASGVSELQLYNFYVDPRMAG
jgi:hypothetical protein